MMPSGLRGGMRAYGWTADDSEIIANEATELRRIVREVDPALANPKSLRQVVRELNDRKVPTSTGSRWAVTPLGRILINPRLIGRHAGKDGRVIRRGKPRYPAILITDEDVARWERIRTKLTDPRRKRAATGAAPRLLTDYMVCGLCGAKQITRQPEGRAPRYACHASTGCGRMSIQAEIAETAAAQTIVSRAAQVVPGVTEVSAAAWWTRSDLTAQRELIAGLVDVIRVRPTAPGRSGGDRLEFAWKKEPAWPSTLGSAA